jgi:hypothetical protein
MGDLLLIIGLSLLIGASHVMAIMLFWRRVVARIRAQPARNTRVVVRAYGPDEAAIARSLARHTRLDLSEIDELVGARQRGPLPLPLAWHEAHLLRDELRQLGCDIDLTDPAGGAMAPAHGYS